MEYTVTSADKGTVDIEMTFVDEEVEDAVSDAYLKIRGKYTVPGFRKGKAPKNILMNYIGMRPFYEEAVDDLYAKNINGVLEKERDNYPFTGSPDPSIKELDEKKIVLVANMMLIPEVTISQYKGLKIRKYEPKVTDEDVENEVKKAADAVVKTEDVTDRPAENGDTANIDFVGICDGEAFPGGTDYGYDLVLGSGSFIPGFEEQIVGMDVGETKNLDVKFPEDYSAKDMAGKEAVFTVTLNKLSAKKYPELDDEFAKKYGKSDTMEEFREKTKKRLWEQAERNAKNRTESSILETVISNATVDIPERMVEDEKDYMVEDFEQRLKYEYQGVTLDEYIGYMGETRETFRDQFTSEAEKRIKNRLVIQKLVKDENIEATEDDVKAKLTEEAESVGKTYEELKEELSSYNMDYIANDIILEKLVNILGSYNELYVEEEKDKEEA